MLDVLALVYFTFINLYLLGEFPLHLYEFIDIRQGFAFSDYGVLFETGSFFSVSAIIAGLLCGLDAITYPLYKKVKKKIYIVHAISAFGLIGIGLVPTSAFMPERAIHWIFALLFILVYPLARILIVKRFRKKLFKKLLLIYAVLNTLAVLLTLGVQFKFLAYPEYLLWLSVLSVIVISKLVISKIGKKS